MSNLEKHGSSRPKDIKEAILHGETDTPEFHRRSRKGGLVTAARNREARAIAAAITAAHEEDQKTDLLKHLQQQSELYTLSDDGEVLPPDPKSN